MIFILITGEKIWNFPIPCPCWNLQSENRLVRQWWVQVILHRSNIGNNWHSSSIGRLVVTASDISWSAMTQTHIPVKRKVMVRATILLDFQNFPSADGIRISDYYVQCLATRALKNVGSISFPSHFISDSRHETNISQQHYHSSHNHWFRTISKPYEQTPWCVNRSCNNRCNAITNSTCDPIYQREKPAHQEECSLPVSSSIAHELFTTLVKQTACDSARLERGRSMIDIWSQTCFVPFITVQSYDVRK